MTDVAAGTAEGLADEDTLHRLEAELIEALRGGTDLAQTEV